MSKREQKRTPAADAFTNLIVETFRFNGLLLGAGDRMTNPLDLTSALWQVLGAIDENPLPFAQIARDMGLTRQSVRRSANVLKDRGFVEFRDNPNHKRAKLVALTEQGRRVLDQVTAIQIQWSNRLTEGLNA